MGIELMGMGTFFTGIFFFGSREQYHPQTALVEDLKFRKIVGPFYRDTVSWQTWRMEMQYGDVSGGGLE